MFADSQFTNTNGSQRERRASVTRSPERINILVAEDNPALVGVLEFNLSRAGFSVAVANDGRAALDIALQRKFDLIIADHEMPGLSGVELARQLRQVHHYQPVPFYLLIAAGLEQDRNRIRAEVGIREFFQKPFSPRQITLAVQTSSLRKT